MTKKKADNLTGIEEIGMPLINAGEEDIVMHLINMQTCSMTLAPQGNAN